MKMSQFWPKSKAIALVFWPTMSDKSPKLKLTDFGCRLKGDENEPILAKKYGYSLGILANNERKSPKLKLTDFDCRLKSDENEPIVAKT